MYRKIRTSFVTTHAVCDRKVKKGVPQSGAKMPGKKESTIFLRSHSLNHLNSIKVTCVKNLPHSPDKSLQLDLLAVTTGKDRISQVNDQ